jgi:hypothetical protein
MIVGVWIASGTVPVLIFYGLKVLNPEVFLAAGMLLCAVVSVSLGTSWGTTGTIGLALMGIGSGFDIPMYWTAGAVVSGAFFGDKISPLSDTTNLAPAVTGVNLVDHIRNMMPTTVPAMLIALVIYLFVGFNFIGSNEVDFSKIEAGKLDIENVQFNLPRLLGEVVESFALKVEQNNTKLILDATQITVSEIISDPNRLRQILNNLIGNAVKFTIDGEVVITARIDETTDGSFLQCSIIDTGIGIDPKKQASLFDSFTQADASTTRQFGLER